MIASTMHLRVIVSKSSQTKKADTHLLQKIWPHMVTVGSSHGFRAQSLHFSASENGGGGEGTGRVGVLTCSANRGRCDVRRRV